MKNVFLSLGMIILVTQCALGQWNVNPEENLVVASGNISSVKSVRTSNNRLFVSWFYSSGNNGNYDLYVQLLDVNGYKLWDENGLLISSHPQDLINVEEQVMLCDNEDNLVIVFSDFRENANQGLYCYKLSQQGEFLWGSDGLSIIGNDNNDWITDISGYCDSENDVIVSAGIYGQSGDVFLQRITSDKTLPWGIPGKLIPNAENAKVFSTGENIVLLFREKTGTFPNYIFKLLYQFFDKAGNPLFPDNKIISDAGGIVFWDQYDAMMANNNHVIVTWHDDRNQDGKEKPYAQNIDGEGNTFWENNGIALSTEPGIHHFYPEVVGQGSDNSIIIIWQRTMDPAQWIKSIFGQKVDGNGNIVWGPNGKELFPECENFNRIQAGVLENDNFYVSFGLHPTIGIYDTVHYYLGSYKVESGEANWTQPVSFATSPEPKDFFDIWLIPDTQIITTWREGAFTANQEVRAQNIAFDGSLGTITSVSKIEKNILTIYPNPTNDYFRINYNGDDIKSVLIDDILGNIVYDQQVNMRNPYIDVSDLKKGLYFVKFQTKDNKTISSKFIRSQ